MRNPLISLDTEHRNTLYHEDEIYSTSLSKIIRLGGFRDLKGNVTTLLHRNFKIAVPTPPKNSCSYIDISTVNRSYETYTHRSEHALNPAWKRLPYLPSLASGTRVISISIDPKYDYMTWKLGYNRLLRLKNTQGAVYSS